MVGRNVFFSGIFILGTTGVISGVFPSWALVLMMALLLAALVFFTSSVNSPPMYHVVGHVALEV
jgi:acyl-CoA synthetase (AMP-forming)/AMP-acid ligase II